MEAKTGFSGKVKLALLSAAAGALLTMLIGFNQGGWVTGGTAKEMLQQASEKAVIGALAPVCAEKFRTQPGAAAKKAALVKLEPWERGTGLPKEWTTLPDRVDRSSSLAEACVSLILKPGASIPK